MTFTAYNASSFPDYRSCCKDSVCHAYSQRKKHIAVDMTRLFCEPCVDSCYWKHSVWSPPFSLINDRALGTVVLPRNVVLLGDSTVRDLFWTLLELMTGEKRRVKCLSHSTRKIFCEFSKSISARANLSFSFLDGSNVTNELVNLRKFANAHVFLHCPIFGNMKSRVYDETLEGHERHKINHVFDQKVYTDKCHSYFTALQSQRNRITILGQTPLPGWTRNFSKSINYDVHNALDTTFKLCQEKSHVDVVDRYGVVMSKTRDCIHPTRTANIAIARMIVEKAVHFDNVSLDR